jgi:hypothetical protein
MGEGTENGEVISFLDAVDYAYDMLEVLDELPDEAEGLAALVFHASCRGDTNELSRIIEASRAQALSFDALTRAVGYLLRRDKALPDILKDWLAKMLLAEITRPPVPKRFTRGWPGSTEHRDLLIYEVVARLAEKGLQPTRDRFKGTASGCEAVAKAMKQLKQSPASYSGVSRSYYEVKMAFERGSDPRAPISIMNTLIWEMTG